MVGLHSSSWLPPWLETTIASAPIAIARCASSGSLMPLSTSLRGQMLRSHSTSAQLVLEVLVDDLQSGAWRERYAHLLDLEELDLGYRLVVADLD